MAPNASVGSVTTTDERSQSVSARQTRMAEGLPIKMLNDRILVKIEQAEGERRSTGGILIPATAQMGKRLSWATVVAVGPNVRTMQQDRKSTRLNSSH